MSASSKYEVDLSMSAATVEALNGGKFSLYAMFAVAMTNAAARPTIGFATQDITANMAIEWTSDVSAYISSTSIIDGGVVRIGYHTNIDPGQTLHVTAGGIGSVTAGGPASKISIDNTTSSQFTSGIARAVSDTAALVPIYAVPLYGHQTNIAAALPRVLLQFTTETLQPGTLVDRYDTRFFSAASYGPSLLVAGAEKAIRKVDYDINGGWNWGGQSWAQVIPVGANLTEVLIEAVQG